MVDSVLVTRPHGQADALCEALRDHGLNPIHEPMLEIQQADAPSGEQRQKIMDLDQYAIVIFVSVNAVHNGMNWIEQFWPQLPLGLTWYSVGQSSAQALAAYDVQATFPERMDSEGLLALPPLNEVAGKRVLIVKGAGGRQYIYEQLEARGARVDTLECYCRKIPSIEPTYLQELLRQYRFTALLLSSGEGLNNMVSLLEDKALELLADSLLVLPGQRVAELAAEMGFSKIVAASNATDAAMIDSLLEAIRS